MQLVIDVVLILSRFFQAHMHHYTQVDGFEESEFNESVTSLADLKEEYASLERKETQAGDAVPRLERLKISG